MPSHVAPVEAGISNPKGSKEAVTKALILVAQAQSECTPSQAALIFTRWVASEAVRLELRAFKAQGTSLESSRSPALD